jgi:hypothetical protein
LASFLFSELTALDGVMRVISPWPHQRLNSIYRGSLLFNARLTRAR